MNQTREANAEVESLEQIIRRAAADLQRLRSERMEITKRIARIKETICGLATLCEDEQLKERMLELVDTPSSGRQAGLTRACRLVLMEASAPLTSGQVAKAIQRTNTLLSRYKDPSGTVNTVLNRLVRYGEAQKVPGPHGQLAWLWVSKSDGDLARQDTSY
jgi:chorismate mutase